MAIAKVLLVEDDENAHFGLAELLEYKGFVIKTAASVPEALRHITSETYDVLLSDLHMPGAGDGLTVVSAMRHANPRAVTLLLTAFPEISELSRLQSVRSLLSETATSKRRAGRPPRAVTGIEAAASKKTRRTLSPEARKRIADAQRLRWKKQRLAIKAA